MKLLIYLSFIVCGSIASADPGYLGLFVGKYNVIDRKCINGDKICNETTVLELARPTPDQFTLIEINGLGAPLAKNLRDEINGNITSIFTGGAEFGLWQLMEKNVNGKLIRKESVYFEGDFNSEAETISFQYSITIKDPDTGGSKVYRRAYQLAE